MHTHRWPVRSACRDVPSLHRARNGQWWRATAERSPEGSRGTKNCSLRSSSCALRLLLPVAGEDTRALHFEARADVRPLAVPGCRRSGFLCTQSTQHKRENHAGSAAGRKAAEKSGSGSSFWRTWRSRILTGADILHNATLRGAWVTPGHRAFLQRLPRLLIINKV